MADTTFGFAWEDSQGVSTIPISITTYAIPHVMAESGEVFGIEANPFSLVGGNVIKINNDGTKTVIGTANSVDILRVLQAGFDGNSAVGFREVQGA